MSVYNSPEMKDHEGDSVLGDADLSASARESFHERIRRVGVEAPPGGQFYVQSHHSYGLPRWYRTDEQRERLLAAADRVIERLKSAPDEYWAELEDDATDVDDSDLDEALESPEVRRMLGTYAVELETDASETGSGEATD